MELKMLIVSGDYAYKDDFQKASLKRNVIVEYAKTMNDAIDLLVKSEYSLVVIRTDTIDYMSGLSTMREIRQMPIILISYNEPSNNIDTIQDGARIFLLTPYSIDYLVEASAAMARYYSNLKDSKKYVNPTVFFYKHLILVSETHQVFFKEMKIRLTKKEFDLLKYFIANRGTALSYEQIHNQGKSIYF